MSALELQKSVYAKLNGNGYNVYDAVPEGQAYPYIVIGNDTLINDDTDTTNGIEATITIHTWGAIGGYQVVKEMQSAVYDLLHRQELSITGYTFTGCAFEFSDSFADQDGVLWHGVQRFRINYYKNA